MQATGSTSHAENDAAFENYDLKAEAPEAHRPSVRFAFDFPELLTAFEQADAEANRNRDSYRRRGVAGILLVFLALLYPSAGPLVDDLGAGARMALAIGAGALGLIGTFLGVTGLRRRSQRKRWLTARLRTETLRPLADPQSGFSGW